LDNKNNYELINKHTYSQALGKSKSIKPTFFAKYY